MSNDFLSVTKLNNYVKDYLDQNINLRTLYVRGEVLNIKYYPRQAYFTLKDENDSRISAVMFLNPDLLAMKIKDGDDLIVTGSVSLYAKSGTYQLIVSDASYYGIGAKLVALQKLREKLAKTGIFDQEVKLKLPRMPFTIGVIAGKDSAAWADIKTNIHKRFPLANIIFTPALVQGEKASADLIRAYKLVCAYNPEVIIIARGGGSSDDLWAFNDEELVNVLAKRNIPLISAVGHEIDTTLVDYVSDLRVSTPTAAATRVSVDILDIRQDIFNAQQRMISAMENKLNSLSSFAEKLTTRKVLQNPENIFLVKQNIINLQKHRLATAFNKLYISNQGQIINHKNNLDTLLNNKINNKRVIIELSKQSLNQFVQNNIKNLENVLNLYQTKLDSISPLNVLKRGYGIVVDEKGNTVKNIDQVEVGSTISTRLYKQTLISIVKEKKENE